MLGRHADAFFKKQATERVVANMPNGDAQSIGFPDREKPGTHVVGHVKGAYETPGPQTVVDANNMLPGMGEAPVANPRDMLPGMGMEPMANPKDMLPGMGGAAAIGYRKDMLPGMGNIMPNANPKDMLPGMGLIGGMSAATMALLAAAGVAVWYFGFRKA